MLFFASFDSCTKQKPDLKNRLNSFRYAFNGLRILLLEEPNARIHFLCTVIALALGFLLHITPFEWIAVTGCIGLVFSLEIINSAIEALCDHVTPEKHPQIKKVKDLSAAGVLIAALAALVIGLIIFLPKLIVLCFSV